MGAGGGATRGRTRGLKASGRAIRGQARELGANGGATRGQGGGARGRRQCPTRPTTEGCGARDEGSGQTAPELRFNQAKIHKGRT
ncbi:hypothetical protein GUJ93_ZPchr0010g8952 [Zizania palustris]|uniref:Uncharacterized protein n=1 Tax=Zizania palustris TaxID=103762 RepID=A0A8J5W7X3_ZIZPA|nr:hypothetical protein GUJ93_ZPchr0010g8952 [Zizania palustris]